MPAAGVAIFKGHLTIHQITKNPVALWVFLATEVELAMGISVYVWLHSRPLPAGGRVGLEVHRCLCITDAGNVSLFLQL
jgi:hypothetical protein